MVQYRDLNAPPSRMLADVIADMKAQGRQSKTGDAGVKDLGETGDVVWPRPDGSSTSVREVDEGLEAARDRIEDAEGSLTQTGERLNDAVVLVGEVQDGLTRVETEVIPGAVEALEQADGEARRALTDLGEKLSGVDDTAALAAQLKVDLATTADQLAVAEQNLTALRDATLPGMRADLEDADAAAQETLAALDNRLGAAESTLTAAQDEITALQSLLEGTDLGRLQVDLQAALADIAAFQTETMPALEARLRDAEDVLTQLAGTDIGDMQVRLTAAESAVSDLQTTTLPALEASLDARIAQGQAETEAALAAASGEITAAQAAIDAARDRLDAHDTTITGQAEVLDVVAKQVSRGPTPPAGAPLGAQWVTPEGYLYVRVDCDEEAA